MIGTRVSMMVGVCAALLVLVIGRLYGSISGYAGGMVDAVMQRSLRLSTPSPRCWLSLLLASHAERGHSYQPSGASSCWPPCGANLISMFIAFGLPVLGGHEPHHPRPGPSLKQQEYVTAAALGASSGRIIKAPAAQLHWTDRGHHLPADPLRHLPGVLPVLPGRGRSRPHDQPGLHGLRGAGGISTYPYRLLFPAIILSIMILSFNLFGDGLRDALDPRLKK